MDAVLPDEERAIADGVRDFLDAEAPLERNLAFAEGLPEFDRRVIEEMGRLGFFGMASAEAAGGLGLPFRQLGLLAHGAGRVLLAGPWLEQVLAVRLLERAGALSAALLAGRRLVTLPLDASTWERPLAARRIGDGLVLDGEVTVVGHATAVDGWLVPAAVAGTAVLAEVVPDPDRAEALPALDQRGRPARLRLAGAPARLVADLPDCAAAALLREASALLSMASVGSAEALLAMTVAHLRDREQFGRPLGTFQALKHRVADVFIDLEHTQYLALAACEAPDSDRLTGFAKLAADELHRRAAEEAMQLHGGIGFTWEVPIHHHLKAALRQRLLPRPAAETRHRLRAELGIL